MLIDTHCHLNDRKAYPDPGPVVVEAHQAGVERLIVVGVDIESSEYALELADRFEGVYAVVGLHPNESTKFDDMTVSTVERLCKHPKAVAIGEIGLDYHWEFATKEQQLNALEAQLDLAEHLESPIVFHCREAYSDLLEILEHRQTGKILLHCFGGDQRHLERALDLGAMIGVDGPITYPKADSLRELISRVPQNRLLLETDAPWMSPHPFRGRPNSPARLTYIRDAVAALWNCEIAKIEEITSANASQFFGLN